MSNTEVAPQEILCETDGTFAGVELLVPRQVPLGGPARDGCAAHPAAAPAQPHWRVVLPGPLRPGPGRRFRRHERSAPPAHRACRPSAGCSRGRSNTGTRPASTRAVRPGEVNLMTAGRGISHSEFSTPDTTVLHGAQLWVALPDAARHMAPTFEHYRPEPVSGTGWTLRVFLGSLSGSASPVTTHTPLLGAELLLEAGDAADPGHRCLL